MTNQFDKLNIQSVHEATVIRGATLHEMLGLHGRYIVECRDKYGNLKWEDVAENTVTTVGLDALLDAALAGSSYTVVGPYMGLISSVSWSATAQADTMASHSGWLEAGGTNAPTYSGGRKTCAWSAASARSKALSSPLSFNITGSGTVKGTLIVYGTGAVSTVDNTSGVLFSAGVFTGGDKVVANTDIINANYSISG